jgi:hypothetical protein
MPELSSCNFIEMTSEISGISQRLLYIADEITGRQQPCGHLLIVRKRLHERAAVDPVGQDQRARRRRRALRKLVLGDGDDAFAAEVTPERLINADREPQNWLMNHRTYNGQRFSPLARISRENVKSLKLAYAVPIAGTSGNEAIEATPLAEDGFLYITDSWGVLYKIDGRSGEVGGIVWRMEPHQEKQRLIAVRRCGAIL